MRIITIDKRVPFGFKGEWGKVYKIYNPTQGEDYADTSQIKGKWAFDESISVDDADFWRVSFSSNNIAFDGLEIMSGDSDGGLYYLQGNSKMRVYTPPDVWADEAYMNIAVTSDNSEVSGAGECFQN